MHETYRDPSTAPSGATTLDESLERRIGLAIFVIALIFYLVKAPGFAVPGRTAGILTAFSGMDPFRPLVRPLWAGILHVLSSLPIGNLAAVVNGFTALVGAATCWLVYSSVRLIPFSRSFRRKGRRVTERIPRLIAGIFAALYVAVSFQMIMVATRGDYAVFDVFLLLLAFYPAFLYLKKPRPVLVPVSCLLFGLALAEYPTMAMVLPGFLLWWLYLLWRSKWPKASTLALSGGLLLSGFVAVWIYLSAFAGSEAAAIREVTTFGDAFREYAKLYYGQLVQSTPKVGWLLIFGINLLPFILVVLRELEEPNDRFTTVGVYAFRLVLFALAVLTLFRLPGSPARVLGARVFLLAPSIIVAVWFGFLVGYHYGLFIDKKKRGLAYAFVGLWGAVLLGAGVYHAQETRLAPMRPLVRLADEIIAGLDGRTFLLTDGFFDDSLKLAARNAGQSVRLINIRHGQSAEHGRYHASMFEDPELQNLAMLGTQVLLRGWLLRDPAAADSVAVLTHPEPIETQGFRAVPTGYFYALRPEDAPVDAKALFERMAPAWSGWRIPEEATRTTSEAMWAHSGYTAVWLSRQANDIGVLLDDAGHPDLAAAAYAQSMAFWDDNMSATLNLLQQARRRGDEDTTPIEERLQAQIERNPSGLNILFLRQFCGNVRDPVGMLQEAALLGRAGLAQQALGTLDKLSDQIEADDIGALLAMAQLYLRGENLQDSLLMYRRVFALDPANLDALYGVFRVALHAQKLDEAERALRKIEEAGVDADRLIIERAEWLRLAGRTDEALDLFLQVSRQAEASTYAWFAVAQIAIQRSDDELLQRALAALDRDRNYLPGMFMLGEYALSQGQIQKAREYFSRVLVLDPTHIATLMQLCQLDFNERDVDSLRRHSGALLALDPGHAYGNYMSAFVHIDAERYDLAEAALRRSLAREEYPATRHELAFVLREQGRLEEALENAQRSVELERENARYRQLLDEIRGELGLDE